MIGVPTIPQSCDKLMKFPRPRVALGIPHMLLVAEVGCFHVNDIRQPGAAAR